MERRHSLPLIDAAASSPAKLVHKPCLEVGNMWIPESEDDVASLGKELNIWIVFDS